MIHLPQGMEMLLEANNHKSECPTCRQGTLLRPLTLSKRSICALFYWRDNPYKQTVTPDEIRLIYGAVAYANYTLVKHWDLIRPCDGGWERTETGKLFMEGVIEMPETLWVYNDHARIVPQEMLGRYVNIQNLDPGIAPTRREMVEASVALDVSGQAAML